jgi:Lrp/AsnC family transcriptional regulator for asnA, asnC and gidA
MPKRAPKGTKPSKVTLPSVARAKPSAPQSTDNNAAVRGADEADQLIIDLLRQDGRITIRELAGLVKLTEASVRSRLRALEEADAIRVTATANISKLGQHYFAPIGISVKDRSVDDVAADLAKIPEVVTVLTMIGPQEIELQVVTRSLKDLERVLLQTIPAVRGVGTVERSMALDPITHDSLWMPFR